MTRVRLRRARLGAAISPSRVVVSTPAGSRAESSVWSREFTTMGSEADVIREVERALTDTLLEACSALGIERPAVSIAVVPPLAEHRVLALPGLRGDEITRVLRRDSSRYFPAAHATLAADGVRSRRASDGPVLAAAIRPELLESLYRAAARAECDVDVIRPAIAAWVASLPALWPLEERGCVTLIVGLDDHIELVRVRDGVASAIRRLRAGAATAEQVVDTLRTMRRDSEDEHMRQSAQAGAPSEPVVLLTTSAEAQQLADALCEIGERVPRTTHRPEFARTPERVAAAFAAQGFGPSLAPEHVLAVRRRRNANRARVMSLVAVLALLAAAAFELWGVRRERAHVLETRTALAPALVRVLAMRDSLAGSLTRLDAVQSAERNAPRWSDLLVALATRLPRGAFVLSMRAEGDSLIVEVAADQASPVLEALARAPELGVVSAQGTVRQELRPGAPPLERFTLLIRPLPVGPPIESDPSTPARAAAHGRSP